MMPAEWGKTDAQKQMDGENEQQQREQAKIEWRKGQSLDLDNSVDEDPGKGNNKGKKDTKKTKQKSDVNLSGMNAALTISGGLLLDDATVIGVIDDVLIPFVIIGGIAYTVYDNKALIAKYSQEVDRLLKRATGSNGFQYSLRATVDGYYPNVRGGQTLLKAGDIWKFGETTDPFGRYSAKELSNIGPGVILIPEFPGNQLEIKLVEKMKIYKHVIMNGSLPPGNKIFR